MNLEPEAGTMDGINVEWGFCNRIIMVNPAILQFFHWYYPADGSLWDHAAAEARSLADMGINFIWLPPACKSANGNKGVGYDVYDHFDLGEFDQKGSVPTKYGTKDQYLACIKSLQREKINVIADVILNHKQGADETEKIKVQETDEKDRNRFIGEPKELELYTKYTFPGRNKKYSEFIWDWQTFTGIDQNIENEHHIYKILNQYGQGWDEMIEDELGNFDYLMGADIELRNPHVREELKWWGKWYYETTGLNGFRLDAVKHMSVSFVIEWLDYMKNEMKGNIFCMAEYWSQKPEVLKKYIDKLQGRTQLVDVPLHNNFHKASKTAKNFDLRKLFDKTLLQSVPELTITFVDNHDTQPFQTLESPVEAWFRPHAYAVCLFRLQGIPCIFYPDLYGASYTEKKKSVKLEPVAGLHKMIKARQLLAYGEQHDYFDHSTLVGWSREGIDEKEFSGMAILLNSGDTGSKQMTVGKRHANAVFIDLLNEFPPVQTNGEGLGHFPVKARSAGVWIRQEAGKLSGRS